MFVGGLLTYKHHDAKTVQLCSAGSVFGSIEFLSQTGNSPEDPRVEWRPRVRFVFLLSGETDSIWKEYFFDLFKGMLGM